MIPYIPIVGALIVGGVALYIRYKNRTQTPKDSFGVFIQEQIGALPQRGVREFYDRTKPSIRQAVQKVRHFLTDEQRGRLDRLWSEYDQIQAQEFDRAHEGTMGDVVRSLYKVAGAEFQSPYEIVRYYLDEFYKFSA